MRLFKIGEFALLACVSIRLLRHYEDKGLIAPVEIDPRTSYRYYSLEQLKLLNTILRLRSLGIPLKKIAKITSGSVDGETSNQILLEQLSRLTKEALSTAEKLQGVSALIAEYRDPYDGGEAEPILPAALKRIPGVDFLHIRREAKTTADMEQAIYAFYAHLRAKGVKRSRVKFATLFHELNLQEEKIDWCYGVLDPGKKIASALSSSELNFEYVTLPPIEDALSVIHCGPFARIESLYQKLAAWLADNPYEISGPVRHYHHRITPPRSGHDNITEIIAPIRRCVDRAIVLGGDR